MEQNNRHRAAAIIPARGGSKRLPRKNLLRVLGKPMIYYTIKAALDSELIDETFVSTEDDEIGRVAADFGAKIIRRPPELASDTSTTESVLEHAVSHLAKSRDFHPDLVVLLQPTSPIRRKGDIDSAIRKMLQTGADSLLSVNNFPSFFWKEDSSGFFQPVNYDYRNRPFHHNIKQYRENGSIYIMYTNELLETHCRLAGKMTVYEMGDVFSLEVDTPGQLEMAEAAMKTNKECIK